MVWADWVPVSEGLLCVPCCGRAPLAAPVREAAWDLWIAGMVLQKLWLQKPWKMWLSVLCMSRNTKIHAFVESPQTPPVFIPFWILLQPTSWACTSHCHVCQNQVVESFHHRWHSFYPVIQSPCATCFSTPSGRAQGKLELRQLGRGGRVAIDRILLIFHVLWVCAACPYGRERRRWMLLRWNWVGGM